MFNICNLPIRFKAFAASSVLVISLIALGADAYFIFNSTSTGLRDLTSSTLRNQEIIQTLSNDITRTHINVFRYAAWSSNGVSSNLLVRLNDEISSDIQRIGKLIEALGRRTDLTPDEAAEVWKLAVRWTKFASAVRDTVDVGRVDPAMATMLLGGTDDDFQSVARHLRRISTLAAEHTRTEAEDLSAEAHLNRDLMEIGGAFGILLSLLTTIMFARSLVQPVQAVTRALKKISFGDLEISIDRRYRDRRDEIGQMVTAIVNFCFDMKRARDLLDHQRHQLRDQNLRFNAALTNMSQGLAMFDAESRLIVSNKRFGDIYHLPPELLRPGTAHKRIIEHSIVTCGSIGAGSLNSLRKRLESARMGDPSDELVELDDDRVIAVAHRPMPEGGWVSTHQDITDRRHAEEKIAHMATHDALTGLPNRVLFREHLEGALRRVRRDGLAAVLYLDLDRFKPVNDTLGHSFGDSLLKMVADRLRGAVRDSDTVARLSGDEFAVLQVAIADVAEADNLASRLVDVIGRPYDLNGHQVVIGTSIGIAVAPHDGLNADQLLRNADVALYRAKADGRDTYRFFEAEMDVQLRARRELEIDLRKALGNNEFEVHYQPIIDLRTDQISGFEALLRWRHPRHGLVPPDKFIPIAEEIAVINEIGEWVLQTTCQEAVKWPRGIRLAVNLSPAQFVNMGLVETVSGALATAGLAASRLELEITESVLLLDNPKTHKTLYRLRELGVRISMDDFGTGYSSLNYLRNFPFDKIKIDQNFVRDLPENDGCAVIVQAVTSLAGSLGMTTTAEGVENEEQLEHLRTRGCDEVQGFYFTRPLPAPEALAFLERWEAENPRVLVVEGSALRLAAADGRRTD